jgi:hypothetical protein
VSAGLAALRDDHIDSILFQLQPFAHGGRRANHLRALLPKPVD